MLQNVANDFFRPISATKMLNWQHKNVLAVDSRNMTLQFDF